MKDSIKIAANKISAEEIENRISGRGWRIVEIYVTKKWITRVKLICDNGHEIDKTLCSLKHGCEKCDDLSRKGKHRASHEEILSTLNDKKVDLISIGRNENNKLLLKIKCHKSNHISDILWRQIRRKNKGCPKCSRWVSEEVVRLYFESLFGVPFRPSHPKWLKSIRGTRLQLDGYNSDLKIAFEHQGGQHYDKDHYFSADFDRTAEDDNRKRELCVKEGIHLITIDRLGKNTSLLDLRKTIISFANNNGFKLIPNANTVDINHNLIFNDSQMKEIDEKCKEMGGQCLTRHYPGYLQEIELSCANGHIWPSTPSRLLTSGCWCKKCNKEKVSEKCSQRKVMILTTVTTRGYRLSNSIEDPEEKSIAQSVQMGWCHSLSDTYDPVFEKAYNAFPTKMEFDRDRAIKLCQKFVIKHNRIPSAVNGGWIELFLGKKLKNIAKYDKQTRDNLIKLITNK